MTLAELLVVALGGGGIGWFTSKFVGWLDGSWPWLAGLRADLKRYAVFVLTAFVAMAAGAVAMSIQCVMLYEPWPVDWRAWVERLVFIASTAIVGGQVRHGVTVLRLEPEGACE